MLQVHSQNEYITKWTHSAAPNAMVTLVSGSKRYYVCNNGAIVFDSGDLENCRRFIEYLYMIN